MGGSEDTIIVCVGPDVWYQIPVSFVGIYRHSFLKSRGLNLKVFQILYQDIFIFGGGRGCIRLLGKQF